MSLYEICVRRPVFATMLVMSFVVLGIFSFRELGVDLFPKVDLPTITITTKLEGASPEEIEDQITKRIEEVVNTINGIDELRSTTIEGQSQVFATFILDKDINVAANEVREKVSGIVSRFPLGTDAPIIEKFDPDASPVMAIAVSGARSAREITELAEKKLKRQLEIVKDVGAISLVGDRKREIQIFINPDRLSAYNLSIQKVKDAVKKQNVEIPGGKITWETREQGIRTLGRLNDIEDFNNLIVADYKGNPVKIRDIGSAVDGEEEPRTLSRLDGNNAVSLLIRKQSGTNTVQVTDRIKEKLKSIKKDLPPDIKTEIVKDQSKFIKKSVSQVEEHLLLGAVFASLIVLFFIRNLKTAFIASIAIPTSIISTFFAMRYMGFTLNNMTLLALSVCTGIVIDDAIIVLENIFRHIEEEGRDPFEAAIKGTKEIALAVMATTLSLVVIFLPVAFMGGTVGRFWKSFGITATFAIGISLLVSFTLTPMLSSKLLKPKKREKAGSKKSLFYSLIESGYMRLLKLCLKHKFITILIAVGILLSTIAIGKALKSEFIVDDDMSEFDVIVETPPGSSLKSSAQVLNEIETEIRKSPEVVHTFINIGVRGQYISNVTDASVYVGLKHMSERKRSQKEIMQDVRNRLKRFNLRISIQNINLVSGGGFRQTPFNLVIRGPELDKLDYYSKTLIKKLSNMPGFVDTDTGQALRHPEIQVSIDREKASDLGVNVESVASTLRTMVGGEKVGLFREAGEQYNIRLRLIEDYRKSANQIPNLTVPDSSGGLVKLNNIARMEYGTSPAQIDRFAQERQISVVSNLFNKPLGEAVSDANKSLKEINLAPGYAASFIGRGKLMQEAFYNFMLAFLMSLVFIYIVLAAQFESFSHPVTIMTSIFLSIPFGLLSLYLFGGTLNIYSVMGLFVLIGVVKKNAILQVDYTNTLRARGMSRYDAQIEANQVRLRPILMTTLAIIAGMLPVAMGRGDGSASRASMAIAVVGGQAFCLLITLLITPVVYAFFDDVKEFVKRLRK
ncbi:MAG: efflux RND transporter permease subunit [Deltaproteobacteria bacterium]|nr:efflux RND transporter permease subunit [Deltaproteobacteria bacterium]